MAVPTSHDFLLRFPEFNETGVSATVIEGELASASRRINAAAWGEQQVDGILFLAAHNVALRERVKCCKLISKDGDTIYQSEYTDMREGILSGERVP